MLTPMEYVLFVNFIMFKSVNTIEEMPADCYAKLTLYVIGYIYK